MSFDAALAKSLYTHAPLATFVVDVDPSVSPERRFRYAGWNPACRHLTGLSHEETHGRTPRELVPWMPEAAARAIEQRYQQCVDAGAPIRYEEHLVLDGRDTYWLTSLAPVLDANGAICRIVGMSDEITNYKRLEACLADEQQEQARFSRRLRHLHRLSTTTYASAELLGADYLATGADILGLPLGIISRIEDRSYTIEASVPADGAFEAGASFALGDTLCAAVAAQGETVQYHDTGLEAPLEHHPAYEQMGLRAYLGTPIWRGSELYGTLNFSSLDARHDRFSEQDVELIEMMADSIGHFLELEQARHEAEEARRDAVQARDAAQAASRAKSVFLSTMSHEIRTPLTGVLGFAELLRSDAALPAQQRHYAEVIGRSGEQLVALINDVLDIARIEAGALDLHVAPTDLPALVRDSLEVHAATAEDHSVEVGYEILGGAPSHVLADGRRLRQVLGNLVSNAVKFTHDGQVTVRVAAASAAEGRAVLRFEVADTGAGIAPDALPHIFDSFYQADGSASRAHTGTGLGLAICQKIVRAMGGSIEADSQLGHGTTVTFTVEVGVQPHRQVVVASRPPVRLQGRRALVLDPHAASRELLQTLLAQWGVEARAASTSSEAFHLLATDGPFDVALIEHSLPGDTGADVARQLAVRGTAVPVVLISSLGNDLPASEPAIQAVLPKPIHAHELRHALLQTLGPRTPSPAPSALPAAVPLPVSSLVPAPALSGASDRAPASGDGSARSTQQTPAVLVAGAAPARRGLRVLVAEDDATNRDLIQLVLNGLGVRPDFAVNGADLLDMLEADAGYDLIFMDMMMPVMDGMEAAREVIARYGSGRPRMVALTARALQDDQKRILAGGLDAFIAKPFSREDLRQALEATPRRTPSPRPNGARALQLTVDRL